MILINKRLSEKQYTNYFLYCPYENKNTTFLAVTQGRGMAALNY